MLFAGRYAKRRLSVISVAVAAILGLLATPIVYQQFEQMADATTPEIDYALDFDGSTEYAKNDGQLIPSSDDTFTVEAWVRSDGISDSDYDTIFSHGHANDDDTNLTDDRFYLGFHDSSNPKIFIGRDQAPATYALIEINDPAGTWVHIAVSVNGDEVKVYVDGVLLATESLETDSLDSGWSIGANIDGNERFNGQIDQVKIWNGVLEGTEIAAGMHLWGDYSDDYDLYAFYDFNTPSSSQLDNVVSSSNDMDLFGISTSDTSDFVKVAQTTTVGSDTVITFPRTYLSSDAGWTVPAGVTSARALVIAGGGGGGAHVGGGGGAGGFVDETGVSVTGGSTVVAKVGQGGRGAKATRVDTNTFEYTNATNGQNSSFGSVSATGGGRGASWTEAPMSGGSGGGGGFGSGALGTDGQGFAGGNAIPGNNTPPHGPGGGGGAGDAGDPGSTSIVGGTPIGNSGAGGPGEESDITGGPVTYAGGGGGGGHGSADSNPASGGTGGGGDGARGFQTLQTSQNADSNTGSGGGGGGFPNTGNSFGGFGGSGLVIVRFASVDVPGAVQNFSSATRLIDSDSDTDSITLNWDALTGQSPAVTKYVIEYNTDNDFTTANTSLDVSVTNSSAATPNTTTISGLTEAQTYYFRIKAVNLQGDSAWSSVITNEAKAGEDRHLDFDGSFRTSLVGSIVPTGDNAEFTVEAWAYPETITGYHALFAQGQADGDATNNRFWLGYWVNSGSYYIHIGRDNVDGSTVGFVNIPIDDPRGKWQHVAATVESNDTIKLYIDGALVSTINNVNTVNSGTGSVVGIGGDGDASNGNAFIGKIDQVKVWDGPLGASEVVASMHAHGDPAGVSESLLGHYDFNDFTSTGTLIDISGNSKSLTITSADGDDFKHIVEEDRDSVSGYAIYEFTRSYLTELGGWLKPSSLSGSSQAQLVLAAGGGGGAGGEESSQASGGGGGAGGGIFQDDDFATTADKYSVIIGAGGAGGTTSTNGANGQDSTFASATASGGGGGKSPATTGQPGGDTTVNINGTSTTFTGSENTNDWEGGGGGAGAGGSSADFTNERDVAGVGQGGSNGGAARDYANLLVSGQTLSLSGGGGGGSGLAANDDHNSRTTPASGGTGAGNGGGTATGDVIVQPTNGTANRGGGGGGGVGSTVAANNDGADGGSGVAILKFQVANTPNITSQPSNQSGLLNETETFSVTANVSAGDLSYQWETSDDGSSWSTIDGATSRTYSAVVTTATSGDSFRVKVTSNTNTTATSNAATLSRTGDTVGTGVCTQGVSDDTGVLVTQSGNDCVVAFTNSGNVSWTPPATASQVQALVVAGGGGGGGGPVTNSSNSHVNGGGGGAGGMVETTTNLTTNTPLSVTVGAGGAGTVQNGANASAPESGDNSSLGSAATANGGGAGGYMPQVGSINSATTGGSGGGGAAQANVAYPILGASGTPGQGNSGGNGFNWNGTYQGSGGGGGAGSVGDAANPTDPAAGDGGAGKASGWLTKSIWEALFTDGSATQRSLISDSSVYFSGGGGGGQRYTTPTSAAGTGGIGGGGAGSLATDPAGAGVNGLSAIANSGGGGGGGTASGGAGATGIVVVKYTAVHSVSSISPETGSSKSAINVTITGSKLSPSATLKLTKDGESDVALTNVTWVSSTQITATVPANIASGTWSLVVTQDSLDVTLANSYVASGNFNVEFDELDFDFDKVSNVLSCGNGKSVDDYMVYENVMTKNGVSIDGVVITSALNNASISRYEVNARAGGEDSYFQTDVYASNRRTGGYADFTFVFYLADTFVKDCDNTPDGTFGTQVTLENVNVTGIDIDVRQYNSFTSLDSYTLASNTRLTPNVTADGAEDFPASGSFVAGSDGGSNDPRDQVISTYGEIDTFTVRLGSNIRNTAYFGLAFKALDWGSSSPVTVGDEYTLTYDLNNGSGTTPASVTGGVGENVTLSSGTGVTRSGFTLSGWNTKADGTGISYDLSGNFSMPQNGDTLYAKWTEANYLLSYNANGGTGAPSSVTATAGEQLTISSSSPTRTEFNFAGWNTSADGSGASVSAGSLYSMPSSDTTLFAQWSAITRSLVYDINTGSAGVATDVPQRQSGAAGDSFTVSDEASWAKTNNTFEGWNTAADGSGTDYAVGSQITLATGANTTLYAQWKPEKKRITYSANGGTGAPGAENVDAGSNYTVSATQPNRTGYTFDNWDTQADGGGTEYSGGDSITGVTTNITLYAEWSIVQYTLSYEKNTPTGADANEITLPSDSTVNYNTSVTVGSLTETMNAYRFTGWNTEADGSGDSYNSGGSLILTENKTLHAQWIDATIEIAYNGNGGTGAPSNPSTAAANQPFTISGTEPTRDGYTFAGWQVLDNDPTGTFAAGGTVTPVDDETLVAQWTAIDYTLTYDSRGGSSVSGSTNNYEDLITIPSNPNRSGFTFVGWNTAALGNGTMYSAGQTFRMPASDLTLYAIWTGNPFSLIYSANGGTGAPADEVRVAGTTAQISATVPTRDGYAFAGWDTSSDGSGTGYSPNGLLQMGTSNLTLYAQWNVRAYTLSFNDNNGTGGPADVNGNFGTTTTISTTVPTREGYSFVSWNTACDGSGSDFGPGATFSFGSSNVELCAIWSGTDNQLLYSPNGGTGGPGSFQVQTGATVTVSSTEPTRAGFDFAGWGTAANGSGSNYTAGDQFSMPSSATTLYALWIANPYTVYFNANGGDGSSVPGEINTKTGETVSIPDTTPTRDGYTFNGWKDQSAGSGNSYSGSFSMPAGNLVLYAQWNAINYSLTYDANGGSGVPAQQTGILAERMTIASPDSLPTKAGHWFAGWNTEADGTGVSYSAGEDFFMPLGGDTLYALWVPNEYKLIFNANGGSGGPATNPTDLTFGSAFNIPNEGDLSRTGYTFTYWNEEPDGSGATNYAENGTNPLTAAITITENTVLYAQWTASQYILSFNANTGTGTVPESQTLTYQDEDSGSATLPEATQLSKANATFIGWNTAADGSGTMLSVGEEFTMPASNTVLYAQWRDIFYVVEFNAVDGSGAPASIFAKNGDSVTVPDTEPTKSGYTFSNWEEPQSDAVFTKSQSLTMPGNNLMLFARYTAVTPPGGGGAGLPPGPETEPDEGETEPELPETPTPPTIGGETVTPPSTPGTGGGTGSGGGTGGTGTVTVPSPDVDSPSRGGGDSDTPETEVAKPAPPRTGSIETGDPIDWFSPGDNGSQYDFGRGFQSIESVVRPDGSIDYEKVERLSPGSLQDEQITGFDPDKGLRLEVIGARTGARFVVTEANLIDALTLLNAINASIDAQAAEFSKVDSVLVSSTSPAVPEKWSDREIAVIRDYFEASGLDMPVSLADVNFDEIDNWLTVRASGETYVPGTQVFLTLTSSPLVIGSATVDRFGKFEVEGYLPVELMELGEHRIRVIGMRSLDGISVDEDGNVVISDETMREIEKFDLGTQATVRIAGEAADGTTLNAIRVVPLEPVAPWWTLLFILAAALIASAMKRYRRMTRNSTKVIGSVLVLASAAPAVILGWLSTVTLVTWIGLALGVVATLVPLVITEKTEGSRAKSS